MVDIEKIIIVTKKTWLEELIEKFNTKAQAEFYIEHNIGKGKFLYYQDSHDQYHRSLKQLKKIIPNNINYQVIEREYLPNFLFNRTDLVITIGVDGLVINTAKYLEDQTIMAINPDLEKIKVVRGDYETKELDKRMNQAKLIGDVVENWLRIAQGRPTIVFCVTVKHSLAVCEAFNAQGIPSYHLDAKSPDSERDAVFY